MTLKYPDLHTRRHAWTQGHTNVHVFILMLIWFVGYIKSLFSATCVRVTPTAYHPTGLKDNLVWPQKRKGRSQT